MTGTEAVTEPAAANLTGGIGEAESGEDQTDLNGA
jgi:hypothetical protein